MDKRREIHRRGRLMPRVIAGHTRPAFPLRQYWMQASPPDGMCMGRSRSEQKND